MLTQYTTQKRKQQRKVLQKLLDALDHEYLHSQGHLTIFYRDAGDEDSVQHCGYIKSAMIREILESVKELKRLRGHEKRTPL